VVRCFHCVAVPRSWKGAGSSNLLAEEEEKKEEEVHVYTHTYAHPHIQIHTYTRSWKLFSDTLKFTTQNQCRADF